MVDGKLIVEHCREMAAKKSPVYELFLAIDRANFSDAVKEELWKSAAQISDLVSVLEPRMTGDVQGAIQGMMGLDPIDLQQTLRTWYSALAAVEPARAPVSFILSEFPGWARKAASALREDFWSLLPRLAPCLKDLGNEGMNEIIELAISMDREQRKPFLAMVGNYGATEATIILAVARVGGRLWRMKAEAQLLAFEARMVPDRLMLDKDGRRLAPMIDKLCSETTPKGEAVWRAALDLILKLAEDNNSSAFVTARDLPGRLKALPGKCEQPYLEDFKELVSVLGVGVVGFGLEKLPKLYRDRGPELVRDFVQSAALVGTRCGAVAGDWFLQGRTAAASKLSR